VDGQNAAEFLCLPEVSLEMSRLFLERLVARDPQAQNVVIWDQAGFHPDHTCMICRHNPLDSPLPPYSPELNPVEIIGDLIKDRIANTLWTTIESLEEALARNCALSMKTPIGSEGWSHTTGSSTK